MVDPGRCLAFTFALDSDRPVHLGELSRVRGGGEQGLGRRLVSRGRFCLGVPLEELDQGDAPLGGLEQRAPAPQLLPAGLELARSAEQLAEGATSLHRYLPQLSPAEVHSLLLRTHALTIGLIQMANPVPSVKASYEADPRLSGFKVDFELELRAGLRDWLAGWGTSTAN